MKDISLLAWLTQLGLSTALPLGGFICAALWLRDRFGLGDWVIWAGIITGLICAVDGFRNALKAMSRLAKNQPGSEPPAVSFNDHN